MPPSTGGASERSVDVMTIVITAASAAFPLDAAVFVGLVSGEFPAVAATRVRVIDAIRF